MSMFDMMKKAQEMQSKLGKLQEDMKTMEVVGQAGGGAVAVTLRGNHEVVRVKLQPQVVDAADVETLEDLLVVAMNDAVRQVQTTAEIKMKAITGGLKIPGLSL